MVAGSLVSDGLLRSVRGPDEFAGVLVSTHPPSAERAERARIAAATGGRPALTPGDWLVLRRICEEGKT